MQLIKPHTIFRYAYQSASIPSGCLHFNGAPNHPPPSPSHSAGGAVVSPDPIPSLVVRVGVAGKALKESAKQDTPSDDEETQEDHGPPEGSEDAGRSNIMLGK